MKDLPGQEEAISLGYSLVSYGGDKQSATYIKDGVNLTIWYKNGGLRASLDYIWKLLVIKVPDISFPNKNFKIFEDQILLVKDRLGEEE